MSSKRFFSEDYVNDFLQSGKLPAIHDDIGLLLENFLRVGEICLDMGSCTGLLAVRAIRAGAKQVIALEANEGYIKRAVSHPQITYYNLAVCSDNADAISDLIVRHQISTVIARRVIPEIAAYDSVGMIYELARMFYNLEIDKIFIEGRLPVANAKNHFSDVKKELEAFSKYYEQRLSVKNAYLLKRKTLKE